MSRGGAVKSSVSVKPVTLRLSEEEQDWIQAEVLRLRLVERGRPNRSAFWRNLIDAWMAAGSPPVPLEEVKPEALSGNSVALEASQIEGLENAAVQWSTVERYLDRSTVARAILAAHRLTSQQT